MGYTIVALQKAFQLRVTLILIVVVYSECKDTLYTSKIRFIEPGRERLFTDIHHNGSSTASYSHMTEDMYTMIPANDTVPGGVIVGSCEMYVDHYSQVTAEYTRCAIKHARPLRFCQSCVKEYAIAKEVFHQLLTDKVVNKKGRLCREVMQSSDRVAVVTETDQFVDSIWTDCYCTSCFDCNGLMNGTVHYTMNNDTLTFLNMANVTSECFSNYTQDWFAGNTSVNSSVCSLCRSYYNELNSFYLELQDKYGKEMCMDVVDAMNTTRCEWSNVFLCSHDNSQTMSVILISLILFLLPIMFYLINKACSVSQHQLIVKEKRLRPVITVVNCT